MNTVDIAIKSIEDEFIYNKKTMVAVKIESPIIISRLKNGCQFLFNRYYRNRLLKTYDYGKSKLYCDAVSHYKFTNENGYPFHNYELIQSYNVTYNERLLSLYDDIYNYSGGAHGNTTREGSTWDLKKCHRLKMKDLFKHDYSYKSTILNFITVEAKRRQEADEAHYFENLNENLEKYFEENNFYLENNGLSIFYPLYTISPYVSGIQVFLVPYAVFGDNLIYDLQLNP